MSIEEAIYKYTILADEHHRRALAGLGNSTDPHLKDRIMEAEYKQLANWLQELKERREKESRQIPQDMTEEACEALVKLIEKVIEILPDIVSSVTANMPEAIEQYIESKIRNGKEESK